MKTKLSHSLRSAVASVGGLTTVILFALAIIPLVSASLVAAARDGNAARVDDDRPQVVTITTTDYAFQAPDTIAAGVTTFRLLNQGPDFHHVWIIRLEQGKTMADFMELLKTRPKELPDWAVEVGGPNSPMPGGESNATMSLAPGSYVLTCVIPAHDGMPHVAKGMIKQLTVVPSRNNERLGPATTVMTLSDYDFTFSTPLKSGRQVIRIRNTASQAHEAVIIRLDAGKTPADLFAWMKTHQGPPPAKLVGGIVGLATGLENDIEVDLTPGEYVLLCFLPDATDGRDHVAHGMVKQIRVE